MKQFAILSSYGLQDLYSNKQIMEHYKQQYVISCFCALTIVTSTRSCHRNLSENLLNRNAVLLSIQTYNSSWFRLKMYLTHAIAGFSKSIGNHCLMHEMVMGLF